MIEISSGRAVSLQSGHQPRFLTGLDAGKSSTPGIGDTYYATDTGIIYTCLVSGIWVVSSPFAAIVDYSGGGRALNVTYTNTTGKLMFVSVSVQHYTVNALDQAYVQGVVAASVVATSGVSPVLLSGSIYYYSNISFMVLPGAEYVVSSTVAGDGTNTLQRWVETY